MTTSSHTDVIPATIDEALSAAANYIEQHGWIQGYLEDASGAVCTNGAIRHVLHIPNDVPIFGYMYADFYKQIRDVLMHHIAYTYGKGKYDTITKWNDATYRTKDEVIKHLRIAADEYMKAQS